MNQIVDMSNFIMHTMTTQKAGVAAKQTHMRNVD